MKQLTKELFDNIEKIIDNSSLCVNTELPYEGMMINEDETIFEKEKLFNKLKEAINQHQFKQKQFFEEKSNKIKDILAKSHNEL